MHILGLVVTAMLSSFITLVLHCLVIVGKESEVYWEEEQITKKEEKDE